MNSLEVIGELYRHMEWADACVWKAVLAAPATGGDADIHERLRHLHGVQVNFLSSWRKRPFDREHARGLDLDGLARLCRGFHADAAAYVASLHESELDAPHVLPWAAYVSERMGRPVAESTLRDTLVQAAAHSQYHRGQVNTRLKQVGGTPPSVDYIAWIWRGKPRPEWPAAAA
jgi:uncharacterized damage-inducible protein DinB